jgi:hypothetical protein
MRQLSPVDFAANDSIVAVASDCAMAIVRETEEIGHCTEMARSMTPHLGKQFEQKMRV